ncbi:MAG: lytic transglycosylase domain-containing protein, partial [Actinomycetota bacterium]|nr:lytic transglycosylase domain-containing protein [Actinomycetota bacterium]
ALATPLSPPIAGDSTTWLPVARQAAETCPGLSAAVLVAIGLVESRLGLHADTSSAGAEGPMQFLPSTWAAYGADGDGDGAVDVMNPVDAVHGAARLLCANGGADPDRLASALWNYNHSDDYVRQVMAVARFVPTHGMEPVRS